MITDASPIFKRPTRCAMARRTSLQRSCASAPICASIRSASSGYASYSRNFTCLSCALSRTTPRKVTMAPAPGCATRATSASNESDFLVTTKSREIVRDERRFAFGFALDFVFRFAFGFTFGFAFGFAFDFAFRFAFGFALDFAFRFAFGCAPRVEREERCGCGERCGCEERCGERSLPAPPLTGGRKPTSSPPCKIVSGLAKR
ncbi:MAG: hypothetical protein HDKAJFGB_02415 [Anaerolineae bacterium]|nr:hypothetical protein [Anaerolineae bacterium]